ncbi:MAG: sulfite exporter TauE/SafE family protein, partial [Gammaproteobacteria bacterium]
MIAAWIGALAIGLSLGLLGSGGSVLTVPVLVFLVGQEEKVAIAGSLAVVGSIALVGALPYLARGLVDFRSLLLFGLPGMAGTWLGAWLAAFVSGKVQLLVFGLVMLVAAALMLRR